MDQRGQTMVVASSSQRSGILHSAWVTVISTISILATVLVTVVAFGVTPSGTAGATSSPTAPGTMYGVDYSNGTISSYPVGSTGNTAPTSVVHVVGTLYRSAFDPAGNLWVTTNSPDTLSEFTQAQLAAGGSPAPKVVIDSTAESSLDSPDGLGFDSAGDAWVSNRVANTLVEFTHGQLAVSGAPTPHVTITTDASSSLAQPNSLAIDAAGNIVIGNYLNNTLVTYGPAQLAVSGSPSPIVTLTSPDINGPLGMAFDESGNLWVSNYNSSTVAEITSAQLTMTINAIAPVVLSSDSDQSLHDPFGLGFDATGNLWVASYGSSQYSEYSPAQRTVSGSPTPSHSLAGPMTGISGPADLMFVPPTGYTLVASDGGIFNYGGSGFFGSAGSLTLNKPMVGISATPRGLGYWTVASDGGIFNYGDAKYFGSTGALTLNKPIVGMAATPSGLGYWLVASDGGIFNYGDAKYFGSTGALTLNKPIVGMAATPSGMGYWLVASDGGIFNYGDAKYFGSTGALTLNKPIVGMAVGPYGQGYWLVASDGGIFNYGDAPYDGSTGAITLNKPIVGMAATPSENGYWLVASDGGIFNFGYASFDGSAGAIPLNKPIVGMGVAG